MKLAVVGPRGFVGSRIASLAKSKGWQVLPIERNTPNKAEILKQADGVVHAVGAFMADPRYKQLVNEPLTPCTIRKLVGLKLDTNPLENSHLLKTNFGTVKEIADLVPTEGEKSKIPFVFISANPWRLSSEEYINSKRVAESYLASKPNLRTVFIRPKFIRPSAENSQPQNPLKSLFPVLTARSALSFLISNLDASSCTDVRRVAEEVCKAIEDPKTSGAVNL